MTLRKTFEGDFKKMTLTWGMAEKETKEIISWRKGNSHIILWIVAKKEIHRFSNFSFKSTVKFSILF